MSREDDLEGKKVSREEVLNVLGHPSTWARDERKTEFEKRLRPGDKELGIFGIKGCGRKKGYLGYLRESLERPLGTYTSLVSEEKNKEILERERKEIGVLIDKYEKLLASLWNSREAIVFYIESLELQRKIAEMGLSNEEKEGDEELAGLVSIVNDQLRRDLYDVNEEIKRCEELLKGMGS